MPKIVTPFRTSSEAAERQLRSTTKQPTQSSSDQLNKQPEEAPEAPRLATANPVFEADTGDSTPEKQRGSRGKLRNSEGSTHGRALSFLLTTMPDITDIGFRGGLRFVKRLSGCGSREMEKQSRRKSLEPG